MRPRSPDREAIVRAADTLASGTLGGGTYLQLASLAGLDPQRARIVAQNAVTAGELVRVGEQRDAHSRRPLAVLAPSARVGKRVREQHPLDGVLQAWAMRW